jgi:hypothetical protein
VIDQNQRISGRLACRSSYSRPIGAARQRAMTAPRHFPPPWLIEELTEPMATTGFFGLDELLDELYRVEEVCLLPRRSQLARPCTARHPRLPRPRFASGSRTVVGTGDLAALRRGSSAQDRQQDGHPTSGLMQSRNAGGEVRTGKRGRTAPVVDCAHRPTGATLSRFAMNFHRLDKPWSTLDQIIVQTIIPWLRSS